MKCDMRTLEDRQGEKVIVQCIRDRIKIMRTPYGQQGFCRPCFLFAKDRLKAVSATEGQKAVPDGLRLVRGILFADSIPDEEG